jgi:hypothetical protein
MPLQTKPSPNEVAVRGEVMYKRSLKQQVEPQHVGEFLVVDVETGDYEIGTDYILPTEHLLAKTSRCPAVCFMYWIPLDWTYWGPLYTRSPVRSRFGYKKSFC